jgi:hypothetical protein
LHESQRFLRGLVERDGAARSRARSAEVDQRLDRLVRAFDAALDDVRVLRDLLLRARLANERFGRAIREAKITAD